MWPTETPWPTVLMCSVPAVACACLGISHRSWKLLLAAGLCATIAIAAVVADRVVETDRERVTGGVTSLVRAFERRDEPAMLDVFSLEVIPLLRRRGLFRTAYEGKTLREHYGLAWPKSAFKEAALQQA